MFFRQSASAGTAARSIWLSLFLVWSVHGLAAEFPGAAPGVSLLDNPLATAPNPAIQKVLKAIDAARIEAYDRKLVSFGTRHTLSDPDHPTRGVGAARAWIKAELERCNRDAGGRLEIAFDEFIQPPGPRVPAAAKLVNVVATLPGSGAGAARYFVISGHYDSMSKDVMKPEPDAPGANDDASGTVAVMASACAMANMRPRATIVFMAVVGEEQGLLGSTHWAELAKARGLDIAGMLTNDIVGGAKPVEGPGENTYVRVFAEGVPPAETLTREQRTLISTGGESDSGPRQLARFVHDAGARYVPDFPVRVMFRRDRYLRSGDHAPFLERGYAAVRLTEARENFRHQHENVEVRDGIQYGDLPEYVDFGYVTQVAKLDAATLAALALAPAAPSKVELETFKLENDTTLRWEPNREADIAGYRIVWRDTTAPFWQRAVYVGNVTRHTLAGVSHDDYLFGVQAIDQQGNASMTVYPVPVRTR
jgi:hypothetical protein